MAEKTARTTIGYCGVLQDARNGKQRAVTVISIAKIY